MAKIICLEPIKILNIGYILYSLYKSYIINSVGILDCVLDKVTVAQFYPEHFYSIVSTLTAIIFLHYRVATKMALEISGYTMCRVRLCWLVSLPLEVSKLVDAWLEGVELFF